MMNPNGHYFYNFPGWEQAGFNFFATPDPQEHLAIDGGISFRRKSETFTLTKHDIVAAEGEDRDLILYVQKLPGVTIYETLSPDGYQVVVENPIPVITTMEGPNYEPVPSSGDSVDRVPRRVAEAYAQSPEPAQAGFSGWL